jgi:dipeptidyl aminopeptidase/acylaminoacyl peptidase
LLLITQPVLGQAGGSVQPHWLADGSSFWYAEGPPENTVIYRVDPRNNIKSQLFDTERLRAALAEALGHEPPEKGLPFESFTFVDEQESAVEFAVDGEAFVLRLDTYTITPASRPAGDELQPVTPQVVRRWRWSWPDLMETRSPDGRWLLGIDALDLRLRSTVDGHIVQLTDDGADGHEWLMGFELGVGSGVFSPDSRKLAVVRADIRQVPGVPIAYHLGATEEVEWLHAPKAGQPMARLELFVIDIASRQRIRIDTGDQPDQWVAVVEWLSDGSELLLRTYDRTRRKGDLLAADPSTGRTRTILSEEGRASFVTLVEGEEQFIWASERDGWNHLYLYDMDGTLVRRLTDGAFPVLAGAHVWVPQQGVVTVDEEAGWVYFRAQGDPQRPYDVHLYRVSLAGSGLERLTEQPGYHDIQFAPSEEYYLDTHSSLDRPPMVELRRADGTLQQIVSRASIDAHLATGWLPPEEFVVKAADGVTDLYGALFRPPDFDPAKTYPVIEWLYAGPWTTVAPRRFDDATAQEAQWLAGLGAVVFIVDGRGTPGRGREFEDVVLGSLGRHEIPDHVATLQALARDRPYMDTGRVGVFGASWGGYFTLRAMLLAPDIYHVGVAVAPATDPVEYWADYVEPYLGLPEIDPGGYEYAANARSAANLEGKLLLIHGTGDAEAPFSGTMKMVNALTGAGKYFDLIVLPDESHHIFRGRSAGYIREAVRRYFVEHLWP